MARPNPLPCGLPNLSSLVNVAFLDTTIKEICRAIFVGKLYDFDFQKESSNEQDKLITDCVFGKILTKFFINFYDEQSFDSEDELYLFLITMFKSNATSFYSIKNEDKMSFYTN